MIDEEISLIGRVRPQDAGQDAGAKARAWARLHGEFAAAGGSRRSPRARRGRRLVSVAVTVATVAAMGAAAATVVAVRGAGHPTRQPANGPDLPLRTLELAAATVENEAVPPRPLPHQWVYTLRMDRYALQDGDVVGPQAMLHGKVRVEEWWRFDGKEMAEAIQNGTLYIKGIEPSMRSRPAPRRHPDPHINGGYIGGPGITASLPNRLYAYVASLPTDPDALLAKIRRDHHDRGKDVTTFGVIYQIFRDDRLIPPKANAALYRALARMPGVRVLKDGTDYAGRHGIAVTFGSGRGMEQIILDRRTYHYLGNPDQAVLGFGVVDRAGRRP